MPLYLRVTYTGVLEMNFVIIIIAGTIAYFLSEIYGIFEGLYAKYQLQQEEKKRFKNELYRFKLRQLYLFMTAYYIECGHSKEHAKIKAFNFVMELEKNDYVDSKYLMIKGFNGGCKRNRHCSK